MTGAPFEIAVHFANHLGIEEIFGMEVQTDAYERYMDIVRHNTGLTNAKMKICDRLKEFRHKILFAMGDTHADSELWDAAISSEIDGAKGRAVFINPRKQALAEFERWWAGRYVKDRVMVIPPHHPKLAVIKTVRWMIEEALNDNGMVDGVIDKVA